jgi:hypothetical protein
MKLRNQRAIGLVSAPEPRPGGGSPVRSDCGRTQRVHTASVSGSIEVRGIASWFASERTVREKQEQMIDRYLHDIDRRFNRSS